jgi:hypothetical protein
MVAVMLDTVRNDAIHDTRVLELSMADSIIAGI